MLKGSVALIGLGAIGTPIAHKLYCSYKDSFALVASGKRRERLEASNMTINGEEFSPKIVSLSSEMTQPIRLLIVCVKNYHLENAVVDIQNVIEKDTIILPLQNGISSYEFFKKQFPSNTILQGFVQGPNTKRVGESFEYTNPGVMHIGDQANSILDIAAEVYAFLKVADVDVHLEQDIRTMVWKKWMLNVAGNSVTALTNADYKDFKGSMELQSLCEIAMKEFQKIAKAENILLTDDDVQDVLNYYINYNGSKRTSMLEDVCNKRQTENDYLSGKIKELATKHNIDIPVITTLYQLIRIKEFIYLASEE